MEDNTNIPNENANTNEQPVNATSETANVKKTAEVKTDKKENSNSTSGKLVIEKAEQPKKQAKKDTSDKPNKFKQTTKETLNEVKKISWPSFKTVLKQTGIVIAVVVVFALVIFGFDRLLSLAYNALIGLVSGS